MAQPIVTSITEDQVIDSKGNFVPAMRILFKIGDFGPFTIKIPTAEFTPEVANTRMAKLAQDIGVLTRT